MELSAKQRSMIRRLVQISTDLVAHRYSVYQTWKDLQARMTDLAARRNKAELQRRYSGFDEVIDREFRQIATLESELKVELEQRQKQLDEMNPTVGDCSRVADGILNLAGVDRDNLEPVVSGNLGVGAR